MAELQEIERLLDEKVRPSLRAHGGDVMVKSYEGDVLKVKMAGKCSGCPSAHSTNEELIAESVRAAFPVTGELPAPILQLGSFFKIPNFAGIIEEISPLGPTGWPSLAIYIACIPTAPSIYIIAFGDFISSKSLIETAGKERPDEKVDFNANRSNLCCAIRNLAQCVLAPYVNMCGPLWATVTASISERYKKGRKDMDSIFSAVGTFRWMTFLCVACVPIASFVQPILPASLSLTLLVQGCISSRIAVAEMKSEEDVGIAGVMGTILFLKGSAWGLAAGIILHILINVVIKGNKKEDAPSSEAPNT